jgi:predicted porin
MSKKIIRASIAAAASLLCASAYAQATSSVTLYGSLDQYLNYIKSSNSSKTNTIRSLNDGSTLRSRLGFKGVEALTDDLSAKFQLEGGLGADTGAQADTTRFFDRQAWVGLSSKSYGEFRAGRQNGIVFGRGDYIDFTSRTLGSMVNNFGTPSRYDNDLSWQSPRTAGFLAEVHYALGETTLSATHQAVYQLGLDYVNGPFRVGYADITGKANANSVVKKSVTYRNLYANYDYGQGKVYAVFIRSNNSTSSTTLTNGVAILGNVGGTVTGTNTAANPTIQTDIKRFYNIVQLSADYKVTPQLRIGALYGQINDTSHNNMGAKGGAIGAYYDLSKRTTLVGMLDTVSNESNGSFRPSASAGLAQNFSGADIKGKRVNGVQAGIVHRF